MVKFTAIHFIRLFHCQLVLADFLLANGYQDLWLALPGRDDYTRRQRGLFIDAYEQLRSFDHGSLRLIEPLRGLRFVHYATWLAKRWHDPIFPRTWPHFGTESYWDEQTRDLEELIDVIRIERGETPVQEEITLTNKDYFFDWED